MLKLVVNNNQANPNMTYGEVFMKLEKLYALKEYLDVNDMNEEFPHLSAKIDHWEEVLQKIEENGGGFSDFLLNNKKLNQIKSFLNDNKYQYTVEERPIFSLKPELNLQGSVYYFNVKLKNGKSAPLFVMTVQGFTAGSRFAQNTLVITYSKYSEINNDNIDQHFKDCLNFVQAQSTTNLSEGSKKDILESFKIYENSLGITAGSNVIDGVARFEKKRKTDVFVDRLFKKHMRNNPIKEKSGKIIELKIHVPKTEDSSDELPPDAC